MEQQQQTAGPPPELKQISDVVWELPLSFKKGMRVPARIIASEELMKEQQDFLTFSIIPKLQQPNDHFLQQYF